MTESKWSNALLDSFVESDAQPGEAIEAEYLAADGSRRDESANGNFYSNIYSYKFFNS